MVRRIPHSRIDRTVTAEYTTRVSIQATHKWDALRTSTSGDGVYNTCTRPHNAPAPDNRDDSDTTGAVLLLHLTSALATIIDTESPVY